MSIRVIEIVDSDEDAISLESNTYNQIDVPDSSQTHSRRRPRKSVLQSLPDPDVQFETIAVDDDPPDESQPVVEHSSARVPKAMKTTPNILTNTRLPTISDVVESALEEFLSGPEGKEAVFAIALERVRINKLLMHFGMPEIQFSLYAQPELLRFQFEERLKQHKLMQNRNTSR